MSSANYPKTLVWGIVCAICEFVFFWLMIINSDDPFCFLDLIFLLVFLPLLLLCVFSAYLASLWIARWLLRGWGGSGVCLTLTLSAVPSFCAVCIFLSTTAFICGMESDWWPQSLAFSDIAVLSALILIPGIFAAWRCFRDAG